MKTTNNASVARIIKVILAMIIVFQTNHSLAITVQDTTELKWIQFVENQGSIRIPAAQMKEETTSSVMVNVDIPGVYVTDVEVGGSVYQRLLIPGCESNISVGNPELPHIGKLIEIPHNIDYKIEVVKAKSIILHDFDIYPVQDPLLENKNPYFELDSVTYSKSELYPEKLAETMDGVIRGHRVAFLKFNPIQYNPLTKDLKAYYQIEVRLVYNKPAQIERINRRIESIPFEEMMEALVLNYKSIDRFEKPKQTPIGIPMPYDKYEVTPVDEPGNGCDYLIISHDDLYDNTDPNNIIEQFRDWKLRKGLSSRLVNVQDIADYDDDGAVTSHDIKQYINNAYMTWNPCPTYVLLIGDADYIPAYYEVFDFVYDDLTELDIASDVSYVTVDGDDYFGDLFIGRLPVNDNIELQSVVTKILSYEKTPPYSTSTEFYNDISIACLFEDDTDYADDYAPEDGIEDFEFIEYMEEVYNFLESQGYNPQRIYASSSYFPDDLTRAKPEYYHNEDPLPDAINYDLGFGWDGSATEISNSVNTGCFLFSYIGHGGRTSWGRPYYSKTNIDNLTNVSAGSKLLTPVVLSIACNTGWFDTETDRPIHITDADEIGFCEKFICRDNGGAVAIIGSNRYSFTTYNDNLMVGMYKAIWPGFNPTPQISDPPEQPQLHSKALTRLGQIITYGKIHMANAVAASEIMLTEYNLFGDPEMPVWTSAPKKLLVSYPEGIGSKGEQDFVIKVFDEFDSPVENALVSLIHDGTIIASQLSNSLGYTRFRLYDLGDIHIELAVTAKNYLPLTPSRFISVYSYGATINRLIPDHGAVGQEIVIGGEHFLLDGSHINIYFGDRVEAYPIPQPNGSFGQPGQTEVSFSVPDPYELGPVNVLAHQPNVAYAVDVFTVRTANPIDLYTYSQHDNSTWHLYTGDNPTWNNPEIQLYSGINPVGSNNLIVGQSYRISATFHNDTEFNSGISKVSFKWAPIGSGQTVWYDIGETNLVVNAHSSANASILWTPSLTGHTCIRAEIINIEDINDQNNMGQENCNVGPTSSPAVIPITLWNPTSNPNSSFLELRQLTNGHITKELWETKIQHPDPQVLAPGDSSMAIISLNPKLAKVMPGDSVEFTLTSFINGEIVGGVNFITINNSRKLLLSIHSGIPIPLGIYGNDYKEGISLLFDLGYRFKPRLSIKGNFGFYTFQATNTLFDDTYWFNGSLNLKYDLRIRKFITAYITGGPGIYIPNNLSNSFGINTGIGLDYLVTRNLFLEIGSEYHRVFNHNVNFLNNHVGIIFNI